MRNFKAFAACVAVTLAAFVGSPGTSLGADDGEAAIVVSSDLPIDGISFGDLRRLYRGNDLVAGGRKLVPVTYKKDLRERQRFDEVVLGMSPDEVARYWIDRKIRGNSGSPKALDSEDVVLQVVSKLDGAVGFVWSKRLPANVKVLKVDGKRPGDPGYPLRK